MNIDNLEEIVGIYFDITHEFELQNVLLFKYTDTHSKENGIQVTYTKKKKVSYIPFQKQGYPISLNLDDNI